MMCGASSEPAPQVNRAVFLQDVDEAYVDSHQVVPSHGEFCQIFGALIGEVANLESRGRSTCETDRCGFGDRVCRSQSSQAAPLMSLSNEILSKTGVFLQRSKHVAVGTPPV